MPTRINCIGHELFKSDCYGYTFNLKFELFITFKKKYWENQSSQNIQSCCCCMCMCGPLKKENCTGKIIFLKEKDFFHKNSALGKKSVEPIAVSLANISNGKLCSSSFQTPELKITSGQRLNLKYSSSPSYLS